MGAFIFLFLLWVFILQSCNSIKVAYAKDPATRCSDSGPEIHYPFAIKRQQPLHRHQTLSGFEVLCKDNVTTINLPSYGDLVVKSISYGLKKIDLHDPKNCAHQVFLNLNLSFTPFRYYYVLKSYSYINCSNALSSPFMEIACLSASNYHIYTVDPSLPLPASCEKVKTIPIPFKYSPYLSGSSLGLGFTWEGQTQHSIIASNIVLIVGICLVAVATAMSIKLHYLARNRGQQEKLVSERLIDN